MSIVAKVTLIFLTCVVLATAVVVVISHLTSQITPPLAITKSPTSTPSPHPLPEPPTSYTIPMRSFVVQSFNNCGPASLSMMLSYYTITASQEDLGRNLRPWQNPEGINDDKSVFVPELAREAEAYGLKAYNRPNGDLALLKRAISQDVPVLVRTWLHPNEDIGHYRIVRGYDDTTQQIIQDDSYEGKNLTYSYDEFLAMWQPFNYEYLILIPEDKKYLSQIIIAEDENETTAWQHANERAKKELLTNPESIYSQFNLSRSYYHLGKYHDAVTEFEKVEASLPPRMLWYQTEPIEAYLMIGDLERVFTMTENILQNNNLAYSELYLLRGKAYQKQGERELAKQEFEKAVMYNQNSLDTKSALAAVE